MQGTTTCCEPKVAAKCFREESNVFSIVPGTPVQPIQQRKEDSRLFQGHIRGPVTIDRDHPHVGVIEKLTMLRKPGHTAGYVGQSGE